MLHAGVAQKQGALPCHTPGTHRDKTPVTTSNPPPPETAPSQDVSAPPNPIAAPSSPTSKPIPPTGMEGTYSRDSAWLFWKRSSGRLCSWLRFSRLQEKKKGSGFQGQSNHPTCNPTGSSGHSWGALAHSEGPLEKRIPTWQGHPCPTHSTPRQGQPTGH